MTFPHWRVVYIPCFPCYWQHRRALLENEPHKTWAMIIIWCLASTIEYYCLTTSNQFTFHCWKLIKHTNHFITSNGWFCPTSFCNKYVLLSIMLSVYFVWDLFALAVSGLYIDIPQLKNQIKKFLLGKLILNFKYDFTRSFSSDDCVCRMTLINNSYCTCSNHGKRIFLPCSNTIWASKFIIFVTNIFSCYKWRACFQNLLHPLRHVAHLHYWLPFAIKIKLFKSNKVCSYCGY